VVVSLPKQRGLSPVKGVIQDGSDAETTPVTRRSSQDRAASADGLRLQYSREGRHEVQDVRDCLARIDEVTVHSFYRRNGVHSPHRYPSAPPGTPPKTGRPR
jgi:hypothetical protein